MKDKFFITFCLIFGWLVASAQTYPVQVSTSVVPPYSLHLSDYATTDKLAVHVLFNDPVRFELSVKLKITIEGKGITLSTKPEFNPKPIYLQSGFPERLSGADLAPYFDPRNLNFQGLDRNQFEKKGALPEGVYRICVEVIEHTQNKKVSNSGCTMGWMILNDPPIINIPRNGEKIKIQDPQLVIFNWTPRHTGSPNAAFSTEYEIELVEVRSNDRNPNNAILSSQPIFKATTQSTSIYYSIAETPLIPGQQYAFRVRAKAISGLDELDLFKNRGYSEVFTFTYGDLCLTPNEIKLEALSPTSIKGTWTSLPAHTSYTIRYKEKKDKAEWFEKKSMVEEFTISGLRSEGEYLVQVIGHCGVIRNEDIETYTIKTLKLNEKEFVCGSNAEEIKIKSTVPIKSLTPGEFIESSNFKIALVEVSPNGDGSFSGRGVAYIPWFKLAGLKVEFKKIQVNEDKKVISGNVVSVQSANSKWTYTVDKKEEPVKESNDPKNSGDKESDDTDKYTPVVTIDGTIETVTKDEDGNYVVTDTKGNVTIVEDDKVIIKDKEGNEYTADGQGNVVNTNSKDKDGVAENGGTDGGGTSGSDQTAISTLSAEGLQFIKNAIGQVRSQTDFSQLEDLKKRLNSKIYDLDTDLDTERNLILKNTRSDVKGKSKDAIKINEETISNEESFGPASYTLYKIAEKDYNQLRILQIICRSDIQDKELTLLASQLLIEDKAIDVYISHNKAGGLADAKTVDGIANAIIQFSSLKK